MRKASVRRPAAQGSLRRFEMAFRTLTESEAIAILANEESDVLPFQAINETGLLEIESFLAQNHKSIGDYLSDEFLSAWVDKAESSLRENNRASIEITSVDSIDGHTQLFTLSSDAIEWQICEFDIKSVDSGCGQSQLLTLSSDYFGGKSANDRKA